MSDQVPQFKWVTTVDVATAADTVMQRMTNDMIQFFVDGVEVVRLEKDQILVRGELAAANEQVVEGLAYFVRKAYTAFRVDAVAEVMDLPQDERAKAARQLLESLDSEKQADLLSRFRVEHPAR